MIPPSDIEHIRMDADLEMRKAKARLDQIPAPETVPGYWRMRQYLNLASIGTAYACRECEGSEPPVPFLTVDVPNLLVVPLSRQNVVCEAWLDLDGNAPDDEDTPGMYLYVTRIPIYRPENDLHRQVNLVLISDKDWFIRHVTEAARVGEEVRMLGRRINACGIITETIEEVTHAESGARTAQ